MTERSSRLSSARGVYRSKCRANNRCCSSHDDNVSQQRRRALVNRMSICFSSANQVSRRTVMIEEELRVVSSTARAQFTETERRVHVRRKVTDRLFRSRFRLSRTSTTKRKRSWQICSDWITWPLRYLVVERKRNERPWRNHKQEMIESLGIVSRNTMLTSLSDILRYFRRSFSPIWSDLNGNRQKKDNDNNNTKNESL